MDLQPTKPSKCNSYLAYHLRKSIAINFSLPQCMRLLVRWHLQLLGGSLTFHLINLFFLILSVCRYTVGNSHLLFSLFCRFNQVISFWVIICFPHLNNLPRQKLANSTKESLMTTKTQGALPVLCFFHKESKKVIRRLWRWRPILSQRESSQSFADLVEVYSLGILYVFGV